MSILKVEHLKKIYTTRFGGNKVQALSDLNFSVEKGEYVAIMGESGSGKTTLLNILAALDKPTSGEVTLDGQKLSQIKEKEIVNEKYEFRCFLLRLGMIGDEYKQVRKILLKNLSGSAAFKGGQKKEGE